MKSNSLLGEEMKPADPNFTSPVIGHLLPPCLAATPLPASGYGSHPLQRPLPPVPATAIAATFFLPFYFFLIFASCRRDLQLLAAHPQLPATAIFFRSAAISRPPVIPRLAV
ncbi:hypothetical protein MRB53_028597 [Persea americana]|uniref:Uncharacterized protein n=1 Tax=Persea americana TaxID=3435 RepID=A0ACC2KGL7_PERAE|nr:hypothetical protein MRB53_028597 [Persea americana]